jgi:hypothetical protein
MSDNEKASVPDSTGEAAKAQGWTAYFVCENHDYRRDFTD